MPQGAVGPFHLPQCFSAFAGLLKSFPFLYRPEEQTRNLHSFFKNKKCETLSISSVLLIVEKKLISFSFRGRNFTHHAPVILQQLVRVDHTKILIQKHTGASMVSERMRNQGSGFLHHKACYHWKREEWKSGEWIRMDTHKVDSTAGSVAGLTWKAGNRPLRLRAFQQSCGLLIVTCVTLTDPIWGLSFQMRVFWRGARSVTALVETGLP